MVDPRLFPFVSLIECNFFGVVHQVGVGGSVHTLQPLLDGRQLTKRRTHHLNDEPRNQIPQHHEPWPCPPHQLRQFATEHDDIQQRFAEVGVDYGHAAGPFLDIAGKSLIGVGNPTVQVAQLIEHHILQIAPMEEVCQPAFEINRQSLVEEVQETIDEGGRNSNKCQIDDL